MINTRTFSIASVLLFISLFLSLNHDIVGSIFIEWGSEGPYSHGYLGFIVFIASLWVKRGDLYNIQFSVSKLGAVLLILSLILLLVSSISNVQQLQQASLFLVIVSIPTYLLGLASLRVLFLPYIILALNLPIWHLLQWPLREISTVISYWGGNLLGSEITRTGYLLATPGGNFEVEPACSGLGFFLVSALLAACLSCFEKLSWKQSLLFLVMSISIALVANWVRIIVIVYVGNVTHMNHFIVQDHLSFGWFVFLLFLIPLIFLSRYFIADKVANLSPENTQSSHANIMGIVMHSTFACVIILSYSMSYHWIFNRFDPHYQFKIPQINGYELVSENKTLSPNWQPKSIGASTESFNYFTKHMIGFQVYVANYPRQSQAHEMIYVENSFYNDDIWQRADFESLELTDADGIDCVGLITLSQGGERNRLISYWYVIDGFYTADKRVAKLREIEASLRGKPAASIIAVSMDYQLENKTSALKLLKQFSSDLANNALISNDL